MRVDPISSFSLTEGAESKSAAAENLESAGPFYFEPLRSIDEPLRLEWWAPNRRLSDHVAIQYGTYRDRDWEKLLKQVAKRYHDRCVIVIGPRPEARDEAARKARETVLAAGASWVSAGQGEEESVRADQEQKLNALARTLSYSSISMMALPSQS